MPSEKSDSEEEIFEMTQPVRLKSPVINAAKNSDATSEALPAIPLSKPTEIQHDKGRQQSVLSAQPNLESKKLEELPMKNNSDSDDEMYVMTQPVRVAPQAFKSSSMRKDQLEKHREMLEKRSGEMKSRSEEKHSDRLPSVPMLPPSFKETYGRKESESVHTSRDTSRPNGKSPSESSRPVDRLENGQHKSRRDLEQEKRSHKESHQPHRNSADNSKKVDNTFKTPPVPSRSESHLKRKRSPDKLDSPQRKSRKPSDFANDLFDSRPSSAGVRHGREKPTSENPAKPSEPPSKLLKEPPKKVLIDSLFGSSSKSNPGVTNQSNPQRKVPEKHVWSKSLKDAASLVPTLSSSAGQKPVPEKRKIKVEIVSTSSKSHLAPAQVVHQEILEKRRKSTDGDSNQVLTKVQLADIVVKYLNPFYSKKGLFTSKEKFKKLARDIAHEAISHKFKTKEATLAFVKDRFNKIRTSKKELL